MQKRICLLAALLMVLLCVGAAAEAALIPLDYADLPAAHREKFEAEIAYALEHARERAPKEGEFFTMVRDASATGYTGSVNESGIAFKYEVNQSIVKVGEQIRFTVSDVTSSSAPFKYSVSGLVMDENFTPLGSFGEQSFTCTESTWAGRTFTYTPANPGYVSFVFGISNEEGDNVVIISTNTVQIYSEEKPPFNNMAVENSLGVQVSLDDTKTRVGDVITATATFSAKEVPVNYTAQWTLHSEDGTLLDKQTWTDQCLSKAGLATVHFDYWPTYAGKAQFDLTATDAAGHAVQINTPVMVTADGFYFSAELDKSVVNLGGTLTGTYRITGHTCEDTKYLVGWTCYDAADGDKELDSVCTAVDAPSGTVTYTPRLGDTVEFFVRASCSHYPDIYPAYDRATLLYALKAKLTLSASTVKSGDQLTLNYAIEDGQEPYQRIQITGCSYDQETYRTYEFLQQNVTAAEGKISGRPYLGDLVYFEIQVTEKDGHVSTWRSDTIPMTGAPTASAPALAAAVDADAIDLGQTITVTYQMTGGSGSISKDDASGNYVAWKQVDGTIVASQTLTDTFGTASFTPEATGEYICIIMLTDAYHQRVTWTSDSIYVGKVRIPGDADDNGAVNFADAQLVLSHCADEGVLLNMSNADVNADGAVDLQDALLLLQFTAGWDVKLK